MSNHSLRLWLAWPALLLPVMAGAMDSHVDIGAPYVIYTFENRMPIPHFSAQSAEETAAWLKSMRAYKTRRPPPQRYTLATSQRAYRQGDRDFDQWIEKHQPLSGP